MNLQRVKRIVRGAGRMFDFSGSYGQQDYTFFRSRMEKISRTDREKLVADWQNVGRDMWAVVHQHRE